MEKIPTPYYSHPTLHGLTRTHTHTHTHTHHTHTTPHIRLFVTREYSIQSQSFNTSTSTRLNISTLICCITTLLTRMLWNSINTFLIFPCIFYFCTFALAFKSLPFSFFIKIAKFVFLYMKWLLSIQKCLQGFRKNFVYLQSFVVDRNFHVSTFQLHQG